MLYNMETIQGGANELATINKFSYASLISSWFPCVQFLLNLPGQCLPAHCAQVTPQSEPMSHACLIPFDIMRETYEIGVTIRTWQNGHRRALLGSIPGTYPRLRYLT
jgi:hypothetical protein